MIQSKSFANKKWPIDSSQGALKGITYLSHDNYLLLGVMRVGSIYSTAWRSWTESIHWKR